MSQAYTYYINPESGSKEIKTEHQTSPAYCLTFVRWDNRDTVNYQDKADNKGDVNISPTLKPLIVISDAISVSVSDGKSAVTPSLNIVLKGGDINYASAIGAGDFVLVNMVNSEEKAIEIYNKVSSNQPVNKFDDGFKGVFKVQKVRRNVSQDPKSGVRTVTYIIHGFAFTEFNTVMYFDPVASTQFNDELFLTQFQKFFSELISTYSQNNNLQDLIRILCKALIGSGLNKGDMFITPNQNRQFLIPPTLGRLLNIPSAQYAIDIYKVYLGIWSNSVANSPNPSSGFNPDMELNPNDRSFYNVKGGRKLKGYRLLANENWNMNQIYSILQSFLNSTINEMYTSSSRVAPDGFVYPTLIARQKPFSSEIVNMNLTPTKYLGLPRWRIHPTLIYNLDTGKDEIGRINFVQVYTRSISPNDGENQASQIALGNYFYDAKDIERHGLRPFCTTANFDYLADQTGRQAKEWSELLFDMLNAGQLRESGTMSCEGIVAPVAVGDNIEIDGNVYHIEQITHTMNMDGDKKSFKTNLTLSFGTPKSSTAQAIRYSQMDTEDFIDEKARDEYTDDLLAGFSDTQDLPTKDRVSGEEVNSQGSRQFTKKTSANSGRSAGSARQVFKPLDSGNEGDK